VEVNAQDVNGWTALISAAQSGHTHIVDSLLQHPDIDINIRDNDGWTALTRAVDGGHTESVHCLLKNEGIDMAASRVREVELWESVLESGCELFAQGEHMSLPYDLRRQLGLPEMATRQ
jgi:ankyrin repeat protein